jgi:hypothetical protein
VCVQAAASGEDAQTWAEIESTLTSALGAVSMPEDLAYAGELFPAFICEGLDDRPSCDLSLPIAGDTDGDGVEDGRDLCPRAWDPEQLDWDGDGVGDACDPCPLEPGATACAHDPADIDGDGFPNDTDDCPWIWDDQGDRDADGHGDACDACPDDANPGDTGCPVELRRLADESAADHVAEGTGVTVQGVVVTGTGPYGFFVQDPGESQDGACYVYEGHAASASRGDVVTLAGTYQEYYEQCEILDVTVTVTGSAPLPAPIPVTLAGVVTGGPDAERYEGMLVLLEDATVANSNPDNPDDYGELELDGGLRMDDFLFPDFDLESSGYRAEGLTFESITAVLVFSWENTKLAPRDAADLVVVP